MAESPRRRNDGGSRLIAHLGVTVNGHAIVGIEGLGGLVGRCIRLFSMVTAGHGRPSCRRDHIDGRAGIEKTGRLQFVDAG